MPQVAGRSYPLDKRPLQVAGRFYPKEKGVPKTALGLYTKDNCHFDRGQVFIQSRGKKERRPGRLPVFRVVGIKL